MPLIKLNKNNFFNNLDIISNITKDKDKIALVLKDNAYGHGLLEVATMAEEHGITRAVVRSFDEAKVIESFFEYILVLADTPKESNEKIRYTINDMDAIKEFPKGTKVELKVDTGMHRNGIDSELILDAMDAIEKQGLVLEAVFTHHASADELTSKWFVQNEVFKKIKTKLENFGFSNLRYHSSNSASLFRVDSFDEDMARIGIAAYGCLESEVVNTDALKPVLSLYAHKNSSRVLKSGQRVGYGGTYSSSEDEVVGNYDFGYGDGFMRSLSNEYETPKGIKQVGRISMDNSSFLSADDEILIFDDARAVAKLANTISYEVLTSLKGYIKREII